MSIEAAAARVAGRYEIQRLTVETHPQTDVRLDLRSSQGTATVFLRGVVDLQINQRWFSMSGSLSSWPGERATTATPRRLVRASARVVASTR